MSVQQPGFISRNNYAWRADGNPELESLCHMETAKAEAGRSMNTFTECLKPARLCHLNHEPYKIPTRFFDDCYGPSGMNVVR